MKPKEGTILTVAKGVAEKAQTLAEETDDLEEFLPKLIERGRDCSGKDSGYASCIKRGKVL